MMSRKARRAITTAILVATAALGLLLGGWRLSNSRSYQLFGKLLTRVETVDSVVALTFDDGPVPGYTDSVLAILAGAHVRATFFMVGAALAAHPDVARRVVAAGHELGNHSYSHHRLVLKSPGYVRREIEETDTLIRAAGQIRSTFFRPPYGKRLVVLPWLLSRSGRVTVLWDVEPDTYPRIARDSARIVDHVVTNVRPGSIILLHVETAGRAPGRAALPALIMALGAGGYQFVTVSELIRRAGTS